jgi:hypothetical protein
MERLQRGDRPGVGEGVEGDVDPAVLLEVLEVRPPPRQQLDPAEADAAVAELGQQLVADVGVRRSNALTNRRDRGTRRSTSAQASRTPGLTLARLLKLPKVTWPLATQGGAASAGPSGRAGR